MNEITHLIASDIDLREIAAGMKYFVGADIQAFVRELKLATIDEIFTNFSEYKETPQFLITRDCIDNVRERVSGTLENRNLEIFEVGTWELLYPRKIREILMRSAMVISRADAICLKKALSPEASATLQILREKTFWQAADMKEIEILTKDLESYLERETPSS